ncbi:MAG: patatin-like phospholipase family protein, partial [Geobacteraceae bacterium]
MIGKPYFALASASILLAGCCSTSLHTPLAESAHPAPLGLASVTQASLDTDFAHERAHLPEGKKRPTLGLALSGGGTKAAMYAHGVMHGLNATGLLDHVDVISTTSGGGYAAYWYFSKRMEASRTGAFDYKQIFEDCIPTWYTKTDENEKFEQLMRQMVNKGKDEGRDECSSEDQWSKDDPYRWQAHLVRWPDVFDTNIAKINGDPQPSPILNYLGLGIAAIIEIPLTLIGFDSAVPRAYQHGIERTWGLTPLARDKSTANWSYSNDTDKDPYSYGKRVDPDKNQWEDLRALYDDPKKSQNLPLWVLNTTLGQKSSLPDMSNLYEITPFGHGSPRCGYHHETPPLATISEGVRASAGFADHQGIDSPTGRNVVKYLGKVIGAFEWGVYMPIASNGNKRMRLSDGGGADNLGLISLIRRGLDDIIVVDSAQDTEGFLADLCWA